MAISLANLKTITPKDIGPVFGIIYGPPGLGKTTLASEFPAPVFLQPEYKAVSGVQLRTFGHLTSFADIMQGITELYNGEHNYKTAVLDTIDATEPLLWAATCARNKWASIEAPGYGKGYLAADEEWWELFKGLNALRRDRQMNVLMIGHSEIDRFDDPQTTSYSKYDFRIHKRAHAILEDGVDAILFVNQDPTIKVEKQGFNKERARAEGGATRWIYTERRAVFSAKNCYGMPPTILFEPGKGYQAMAKYFPAQDLTEAGKDKGAKAA